ncbi:putative selenocysteine-tRNA-specific elongation factor, partial [Trypanosoma cruzi]
AERDPADRFLDFGRALLQAFRTQLMTASDPNTPLSKQRARLHTAVHEADAFARAARPLAERGEGTTTVRRQRRRICGREALARKARGAARRNQLRRGRPSTTAAAPPMPPPPAVPRRRRAEPPPDISNCPTQSPRRATGLVRQRSPTVVRRRSGTPLRAGVMRRAIKVARELFATSAWERRRSPAGASQPSAAHANSRTKRRAARPFRWQPTTWRHRPDRRTPGCRGPCRKLIELRWAWRFWGCKKSRRNRRRSGRAL